MSEQITQQVADKLAEWGVTFSARYTGEVKRQDWDLAVDAFRVGIGGYQTDFFKGLGNRKPCKGAIKPSPPLNPRCIAAEEWNKANLVAVTPSAAEVLYCLVNDARAIEMSFSDWCDEYGSDNDSITSLRLYQSCEKVGQELRRIFTNAQMKELQELLQDF